MRAKLSASHRATANPNWAGGTWVNHDGRVFIRVPDGERHLHPTIRPDGYVRRYHYVWNTEHPDNPVQRGEILHHLNHDHTDDRIENLAKMTQAEHASHHIKGVRKSAETRAKMSAAQKRRRAQERDAS